jgi:PleD family two-component response regulator
MGDMQAPSQLEPSHLHNSNSKVLVADDEMIIADTLAMILNQSGFDAMNDCSKLTIIAVRTAV